MKILLGSKNPSKANAIKLAMQSIGYNDIKITPIDVPSQVSSKPINEETLIGAQNRNKNLYKYCQENNIDFDLLISIEGGYEQVNNTYFIVTYVSIIDNKNNEFIGKSQGLQISKAMFDWVSDGKSLNKVIESIIENSENHLNSETQPANTLPQSNIVLPHPILDLSRDKLSDYDYLMNNFYIVDENTDASAVKINAAEFLAEDFSLSHGPLEPQILIYHSHSQETFSDSREGEEEDTIVGVGNYLTSLLSEKYGYQVIHIKEAFDMMSGELDRNKAYNYACDYVEKVLEENPSVEVVIDLHRDGIDEDRRLVTEINGKDTAQILFYNGLSYTNDQGKVSYLPNPYIQDNLAFSFQLEYQAALYYPDFYRGIYLAGLRSNLHLRKRALLLEAGAQTNTVQEVKNAMEPFADILNRVLKGCGTG